MIATCMAWLNDVKAGGGTAFIHPGEELLIEGRKGSMAFWIDTKANTEVLPNASHGGCPVSIKNGLLKVSLFQNVLLVTSFGPKYQQKHLTNSALEFEKWSNQQNKGTFL